jgi:hypothetical protein
MVPTVALPPVLLLTCQVTATSEVFVTVAWNICEAPGASVTFAGDTPTDTVGGGDDPPPQPLSSNPVKTTVTHKPRIIEPPPAHVNT